jgi:TRAP-type C4-dicarboxylate transport system permease small subunit
LQAFIEAVRQLCRGINLIAGIAITFIMLLTVLDVVLRSLRMPITGAYELVAFSGAVVIGFALPLTSFMRGHIFVDFFILKLPPAVRTAANLLTRGLGMGLFFLIGWNLWQVGLDLRRAGEVSLTLQLPFYPVAFGVALCCFVECLVLAADIAKILRGQYE